MSHKRQPVKINISFLLLTAVMFCFILSPMVYILCKHLDSNNSVSKSQKESNDETFYYIKYPSLLINLPEKDSFKDVIRNGVGFVSSYRFFTRRSIDKLLPLNILGLTVGFFLLNLSKTKKNKTVIEFIIGGHAPPFDLSYRMQIKKC